MINRRFFSHRLPLAGVLAAVTTSPAWALDRVGILRIVIGFPPGGVTDTFARRIAEKLRGVYAGTVIVENRPGASAQLALSAMRTAPKDGSVMLYTPMSPLTVIPHVNPRTQWAHSDLAPLTMGHVTEHALAIGPAVPDSIKTLPDFIGWAKSDSAKASIGHPGAGGMPHLLVTMLGKSAGVALLPVPFAGSGPGVPQLLGGQIAGMLSPLGDWIQHSKSERRVRVLATTGEEPTRFLSGVPTFRGQGFSDLVVREWFGFFMPSGTPPNVLDRASTVLRAALIQPDIAEFLDPLASTVEPGSAAALWRRMVDDSAYAARLVASTGFRLE